MHERAARSTQHAPPTTHHAVHLALTLLARCRSQEAGQALAPDIVSYNTVIKLHCAGGPLEFDDAMLVTRALLSTDLIPTRATFGPLLAAAHNCGHHDQVLRIWRHVKSQGLELDTHDDCGIMIVAAAARAGSYGAPRAPPRPACAGPMPCCIVSDECRGFRA